MLISASRNAIRAVGFAFGSHSVHEESIKYPVTWSGFSYSTIQTWTRRGFEHRTVVRCGAYRGPEKTEPCRTMSSYQVGRQQRCNTGAEWQRITIQHPSNHYSGVMSATRYHHGRNVHFASGSLASKEARQEMLVPHLRYQSLAAHTPTILTPHLFTDAPYQQSPVAIDSAVRRSL